MTFRLYILALVAVIVSVGFALRSRAQTSDPEFFFTWKTTSYAPPEYAGKVLPGPGSSIVVSFELIQDGKILDISKEGVYWYVNSNFLGGGYGLKTITFPTGNFPGILYNVRAQINSFRGQNRIVTNTIEIPLVGPEVVIEAPFPGGAFSAPTIAVQAKPYFFNIKNLSTLLFAWSVNGKEPTVIDEPTSLVVGLGETPPTDTRFRVALEVKNPDNIFEFAGRFINLVFRP